MPDEHVSATISGAIRRVENGLLLVIAASTVVAVALEIEKTFDERLVSLEDLLLMFIYVEVLGITRAS